MLHSEEEECLSSGENDVKTVALLQSDTTRNLGKLNSPLPPRCTLLDMETLMLQRFCSPAGHDPLRSREDGKAGEGEKRQQLLQPAWKLLVYDPPAGLIQPLHECVFSHWPTELFHFMPSRHLERGQMDSKGLNTWQAQSSKRFRLQKLFVLKSLKRGECHFSCILLKTCSVKIRRDWSESVKGKRC